MVTCSSKNSCEDSFSAEAIPIFSFWVAPSKGPRWYPRKALHCNRRFSPRLAGSAEVGVKGVVSLRCLSVLLLLVGPFASERKRGLRVGVLLSLQTRQQHPF